MRKVILQKRQRLSALSFLCFLACFGATPSNAAYEKIVHISGKTFEWPGKAPEGDYYPSYNNALFDEVPDQSGITGGLKDDPYFISRFGMFIDRTPVKEAQTLWARFGKKVSKSGQARAAIDHIAQDLHTYRVLLSFLSHGGEIISSKGYSRYTPKPLRIYLEDNPSAVVIESVFLHELSHYLFDQSDSILSEVKGSGGADHAAIAPIVERYVILRQLLDGKLPMSSMIKSLYGFTAEGKLGDELSARLGNPEELSRFIEQDSFQEAFVHAGMLTPLALTQLARTDKTVYPLTSDQLKDLAFLNAFSAEIIREAFRLAVTFSSRNGASLQTTLQGVEFQFSFQRFLSAFAVKMEHGKKSVSKTAYETGTRIVNSE